MVECPKCGSNNILRGPKSYVCNSCGYKFKMQNELPVSELLKILNKTVIVKNRLLIERKIKKREITTENELESTIYYFNNKERIEREKEEREERLERQRKEKEKREKEEFERRERERREKARLEKERIEREEFERRERERREKARLEKDRREKDRRERKRKERLERERKEKERRLREKQEKKGIFVDESLALLRECNPRVLDVIYNKIDIPLSASYVDGFDYIAARYPTEDIKRRIKDAEDQIERERLEKEKQESERRERERVWREEREERERIKKARNERKRREIEKRENRIIERENREIKNRESLKRENIGRIRKEDERRERKRTEKEKQIQTNISLLNGCSDKVLDTLSLNCLSNDYDKEKRIEMLARKFDTPTLEAKIDEFSQVEIDEFTQEIDEFSQVEIDELNQKTNPMVDVLAVLFFIIVIGFIALVILMNS